MLDIRMRYVDSNMWKKSTHSDTDAKTAVTFLQVQNEPFSTFQTYNGRGPWTHILKNGKEKDQLGIDATIFRSFDDDDDDAGEHSSSHWSI